MLRPGDDRPVRPERKGNFPAHIPIAQVSKEPQLVLNDLAANLAAAVLAGDELRCRHDTLPAQLVGDVVAFKAMVREAVFASAMKGVAARLGDEVDAHAALRRVGAVCACLDSRLFDRVEVVVRAACAGLTCGRKDAFEQRPQLAALSVRHEDVRVGDGRAAHFDVRLGSRNEGQEAHDAVRPGGNQSRGLLFPGWWLWRPA